MAFPYDARQTNQFYAGPQSPLLSTSRFQAEREKHENAKKAHREKMARYRAKTKENREELLEHIPDFMLEQARKVNGDREGWVCIAATRMIDALEEEINELKYQLMWLEKVCPLIKL